MNDTEFSLSNLLKYFSAVVEPVQMNWHQLHSKVSYFLILSQYVQILSEHNMFGYKMLSSIPSYIPAFYLVRRFLKCQSPPLTAPTPPHPNFKENKNVAITKKKKKRSMLCFFPFLSNHHCTRDRSNRTRRSVLAADCSSRT